MMVRAICRAKLTKDVVNTGSHWMKLRLGVVAIQRSESS